MDFRFKIGLLLVLIPGISSGAGPKPDTLKAWDEYIQQVDLRTKQEVSASGSFLWVDREPLRAARVRGGEILTAPQGGENGMRTVPNGLIQDWIGAAFIPGVTLNDVFATVHDYARFSEFYRPTVVDSDLICRSGDEDRFRVLYFQKVLFVSELLESDYSLRDIRLDERRWYSVTHSTGLHENPGQGEVAPADGSHYLWRIYGISKYEQRDGGVYVEQENIVLSRPIPAALQWLVEPVIQQLSIRLTAAYLRQTREAVRSTRPSRPVSALRETGR